MGGGAPGVHGAGGDRPARLYAAVLEGQPEGGSIMSASSSHLAMCAFSSQVCKAVGRRLPP